MANNIATSLTNQVSNQSLIPSTGVIQLTLTLKMTTAQVEKCQSLSRTTVIFRTTFTWTIILNLLLTILANILLMLALIDKFFAMLNKPFLCKHVMMACSFSWVIDILTSWLLELYFKPSVFS